MYQRQPDYEEYDYYRQRPNDLQNLDKLRDWELKPGRPDIRGWDVVDESGNGIGKIESLLASTEAEEVIFVVMGFGGFLGMGENRVLIQMDALDIDRDNKQVIYHGSVDDVRNAPEYSDDISDYGRFYDYWSERHGASGSKFIRREERTDEDRVRRDAEKRSETANTREKQMKVHIYRRDTEPGREIKPGERALKEGETIEIPIVREKLVTEKRQEVIGEIVVHPEDTQDQKQAADDVKHKHVTVEKHRNVNKD